MSLRIRVYCHHSHGRPSHKACGIVVITIAEATKLEVYGLEGDAIYPLPRPSVRFHLAWHRELPTTPYTNKEQIWLSTVLPR